MGVPQLFQWVFYRWPKAVKSAKKGEIPSIDCLYFDLNSVIHNCCHGPDALPEASSEDDMILRVFEVLDEMIEMVAPKKMVYLAFDGVVPAGKLVEQRARRFRSDGPTEWDSNQISPGTTFMMKVKDALSWFIYDRAGSDQVAKKLAFVLSDSSVPGEGEQKIIQYMKELREDPGYNPNTTHCICSQDADMILLGLLAHTPHVYLLREFQEIRPPKGFTPRHLPPGCLKWDFVNLGVVREYVAADYCDLEGIDVEKCIDDFVLLSVLMGCDFLPCLPSVAVKDGMLEAVLDYHKQHFHGHLIEEGKIRYDRLFYILDHLAQMEHLVFRARTAVLRHAPPPDEFDFTTYDYPRRYIAKVGNTQPAEYLQGLTWCIQYFFTGDASWEWLYKSPYPPLVSSVAAICREFKPEPTSYTGPCLTPIETLLAILPKASSMDAVPRCLQVLTDASGPLASLHREDIKVEKLAGRTLTIADPVDTALLKTMVGKLRSRFNSREKELDTLGTPLVFANKDVLPGLVRFVPVAGGKRSIDEAEVPPADPSHPNPIASNIVGTVSTYPKATPLNGSHRLSWDLLDPVDHVEVCCAHLAPTPTHRHHPTLLPGTTLPPKTLSATESVMGSEKVFPPIVDIPKPK